MHHGCGCDECQCGCQECRLPLLGDRFPEMEVMTTHGMKLLPNDYQGHWLVFFSHPADFTPVCTTEFVSFQKHVLEFDKLNTKLVGFSVDQVFSHLKWIEWIKEKFQVAIEFPIVADTGVVADKLGLIHPGKGTNTVRAVFVVDDKGIIRTILYYPQELGRNIAEVVRIVKALQLADKNKVAMPANWPEGELFKDDVIVPPANSAEAVKQRLADAKAGKHTCVDWWLCHKSLN